MAKIITLEFTEQPATYENGFKYVILVNGFEIVYNNGLDECNIAFIPFGAIPANINQIALGVDVNQTVQKTLDHLIANFVNSGISYTRNGLVIEILVNYDCTILITEVNEFILASQTGVEPTITNLKYFLIFGDYTLNILKKNYLGTPTEIYGSFVIKKSSVDNILDPIRGTGLEISLEANETLTFDEFILEPEFTYSTVLTKNSTTIFKGHIKPDGIQQSFVNDLWLINIESNDGLGALKDLSFVQENGTQFTGRLSMYDVIKGCLDRTRLSMDINTSIGIAYTGYVGSNILDDVYVNSERFIKTEKDNVIMDCNEVLTSILNLFSGIITQENGEWWILRPNDLAVNGYNTFINQTKKNTFTINLNKTLGSQIDNYYPHHCDANQQIEIKGAISAYRLNYQYGFLDGILNNPNLNHTTASDFDSWLINGDLPISVINPQRPPNIPYISLEIINTEITTSGLTVKKRPGEFDGEEFTVEVATSNPIAVQSGEEFTFKFKGSTLNYYQLFTIVVKTNTNLFLRKVDNQNIYEWSTNGGRITIPCGNFSNIEQFITAEILMPPLPTNCDITVIILSTFVPVFSQEFISNTLVAISTVSYVNVVNTSLSRNGIVGEFHTVSRLLPPSSITKENQKVFNGDGISSLIGTIYKSNGLITTTWNRVGKIEELPLLGISAMDDLRIQANPCKVFSGSVYGELPYLSVVRINNVSGLFMPIEYDFDYKSNKSQIKLMQFYNSDLGDIEYQISPDYGNNTIKPTIKG